MSVQVRSLNLRGEIGGVVVTPEGPRGVILSNGTATILGTFGGSSSSITRVADNGHAAGVTTDSNGIEHAFFTAMVS